jgi:hypothetical protein
MRPSWSPGGIQNLPWLRELFHQDHPGIAIGFVTIFAQMAGTIPFPLAHAADEKAAHLTKSDRSLEKRVGSTHWSPLCGGVNEEEKLSLAITENSSAYIAIDMPGPGIHAQSS